MKLEFRKISTKGSTILLSIVDVESPQIVNTENKSLNFLKFDNRWWVVIISDLIQHTDMDCEIRCITYDVYNLDDYYNYFIDSNTIDINNTHTYPKRYTNFIKNMVYYKKINKRLELIEDANDVGGGTI